MMDIQCNKCGSTEFDTGFRCMKCGTKYKFYFQYSSMIEYNKQEEATLNLKEE